MAIDPVKVPTDIQIEEKIVGPVSLRQIFLLLATGGVSYVLWSAFGSIPGSSIVIKILSWLPLLVGIAFAFIKIHDVSLFKLLLLNIEKLQKPTTRTFGPRQGITVNIRIDPTAQDKRPVVKDRSAENQMEQLSTVLDTGLDGLANVPVEDEDEMPAPEPVRREKISASPAISAAPNIDGMTAAPRQEPSERGTGGLLRDLSPA
jgi:hypothetical protein